MSTELLDLLKERAEQQQQIRELADNNSILTQQKKQAEAELERQVYSLATYGKKSHFLKVQ